MQTSHSFVEYHDWLFDMTVDQVEVLALRDPQKTNDDSAAELGANPGDFPNAQETTGTPNGDGHRWLKEHKGSDGNTGEDVKAPMQVQVQDLKTGEGKPQSGWLSLEDARDYIKKGRN